MTLQINTHIKIFDDFLSSEQFDELMNNIKNIDDKFKTYQNNHFLYERIFLNDHFTDNPIQILIRNLLGGFGYNKNDLDVTVTSYQMAQRYDWHDDNTDNRSHNYILYLTDQEWFEGGELEVKVDGKIQTITPKKNMLVIMDAKLKHRVLPVKTKISGIWQMSRLTLNGHIRNQRYLV